MLEHSSLRFAHFSDCGQLRKVNEDALLCAPSSGLFAIADGLGGHDHGQFASQCLIGNLCHSVDNIAQSDTPLLDIKKALEVANQKIYQQSLASHCIAGSTLVLLWLEEDHYHLIWSGDSRCYLFRQHQLTLLTQDHRVSGSSNQLTQAFGIHSCISPDYRKGFIYEDDVFVLCSDGISDSFSHRHLESTVNEYMSTLDIEQVCRKIHYEALKAQAKDNLSLIMVDVGHGQSFLTD